MTSEGSEETWLIHSLAGDFAVDLWDRYPFCMGWLILALYLKMFDNILEIISPLKQSLISYRLAQDFFISPNSAEFISNVDFGEGHA